MLVKVDGAPGYGTFYGRPVPGLSFTVDDRGQCLVIVDADKDLHVVPSRFVTRFISPRRREKRYAMRGNATIPSDLAYDWSRVIGGVAYDFSRVRWADGTVSVRAWRVGTSGPVHEWES